MAKARAKKTSTRKMSAGKTGAVKARAVKTGAVKTGAVKAGAAPAKGVHQRIWDVVRQIPEGRVVTYGQVAAVVTTNPRIVGFAMAGCPDDVPWHRVVNARGEISVRGAGDGASEQRRRLRREGVRLDRKGRLDLEAHGWLPS